LQVIPHCVVGKFVWLQYVPQIEAMLLSIKTSVLSMRKVQVVVVSADEHKVHDDGTKSSNVERENGVGTNQVGPDSKQTIETGIVRRMSAALVAYLDVEGEGFSSGSIPSDPVNKSSTEPPLPPHGDDKPASPTPDTVHEVESSIPTLKRNATVIHKSVAGISAMTNEAADVLGTMLAVVASLLRLIKYCFLDIRQSTDDTWTTENVTNWVICVAILVFFDQLTALLGFMVKIYLSPLLDTIHPLHALIPCVY
jgi:hypothetical protein